MGQLSISHLGIKYEIVDPEVSMDHTDPALLRDVFLQPDHHLKHNLLKYSGWSFRDLIHALDFLRLACLVLT